MRYHVNKCYRRETYINCYSHLINPTSGPNLWPKTGLEGLLPPPLKRPLGRPRRNRRNDPNEPCDPYKVKKSSSVTCTKCVVKGHNTRTCIVEVDGNKKRGMNIWNIKTEGEE